MKNMLIILTATVALLTSSCSTSTNITSSWKAADIKPQSYQKILVLGIMNEPDRSLREQMEAMIAADLKQFGYNATCSCDEYGPKAFEGLSEQEALNKLTNGGIDAVLTVVLLDKTKERYYVPGWVQYSPYVVYNNRFWSYYNTMYDRIYTPGYYVTSTRYFWESNFYDIKNKTQLLYSSQSQSFDPPSASSLSVAYASILIKDMRKSNVIADQTQKKPLAF